MMPWVIYACTRRGHWVPPGRAKRRWSSVVHRSRHEMHLILSVPPQDATEIAFAFLTAILSQISPPHCGPLFSRARSLLASSTRRSPSQA